MWVQFIAVPFYLSLSRIGEADNPGPAHATANLFGVQFEAIGQWAANLTSKSEMELTPFLAQIGKCRQMFSESFEKESHPYTSSVSQNIQGSHSQTDSLSPYLFPLSLVVTLNNSAILSPSFKLVKNAITNAMEVGMFRLRCSFVTEVTNCATTPMSSLAERMSKAHWKET